MFCARSDSSEFRGLSGRWIVANQADDGITDFLPVDGLGAFYFLDERDHVGVPGSIRAHRLYLVGEVCRRSIIGAWKAFLLGDDIAAAGTPLFGGSQQGTIKVVDRLGERYIRLGGMIGRP